jgi:Zn-dependent protease with chaperone function
VIGQAMRDTDIIPVRSDLIERIQRANRLAAPWVVIQFILAIMVATQIKWPPLVEEPLFALIAALVIVGPYFMGVLRSFVLNKREIGDLKEQTRFGEFDKYRLRTLMDDTLDRLELPRPGPPVYITADKSLNAGAMHLGLGGFFRSLNGVYLNRQVLHRLTPKQVQDIIGHELGHFYRYYLLTQRFQGLTLILGALLGVLVTQWIGMSSFISMIVLSACSSAVWFVSGLLIARNAMAIEFLCDDFGAQVHGVIVSINGLLAVGADSEMQLSIQQQELSIKRYKNLDARDVIEAIQAAIPYGHTSRESLEQAVAESLKKHSTDRRRLTVSGFLKYAWQGEDETQVEEQVKKLRVLQNIPRIEWDHLIDRPGQMDLDERRIAELVDLIETHPHEVLFRLPDEVGETDGVHPPLWARILYLWKNREEIESRYGMGM